MSVSYFRTVANDAHHAKSLLRSENVSFATLANTVTEQENTVEGQLAALWSAAPTLTRATFAARLTQIELLTQSWLDDAARTAQPSIVDGLNHTFLTITTQRVAGYRGLIAQIATRLELPIIVNQPADLHPVGVLQRTATQWNALHSALRDKPGVAVLATLSTTGVDAYAGGVLNQLSATSALTLHRNVSISAVRVSPSPLPSTPGRLLLPSVPFLTVGVTVTNGAYVTQPVTITVRLTPTNGIGREYSRSETITLGPLASYAFNDTGVVSVPSEQGRLYVSLSGIPGATSNSRNRTYYLQMAGAVAG